MPQSPLAQALLKVHSFRQNYQGVKKLTSVTPGVQEFKTYSFDRTHGSELRGPAFNRHSRLREIHEQPKHKTERAKNTNLSFIDVNPFHSLALENFLRTVDKIIRFNTSSKEPDLKQAYERCQQEWINADKFLGRKDLLAKLTSGHPELKHILEQTLIHNLTGYERFAEADEVALAHIQALTTKKPMNIVFGDIRNVGGTNDLYKSLIESLDREKLIGLARKLDIGQVDMSLEKLRTKIAKRITDWSVRIITGILRKTIEAKYGQEAKFLGLGGDEFYILAPGPSDELKPVLEEALIEINTEMKNLGLDQHAHRKPNKAKGLGVFLGVSSLNDPDLTLEKISQKSSGIKTASSIATTSSAAYDIGGIVKALEDKHSDFKPQPISEDTSKQILVLNDQVKKPENLDYILRAQLFTMMNNNTGVQDVQVLPNFIHAMNLKPGEFFLIPLACKNITAINDNASHEEADQVLKDFAQTVRSHIQTNNSGSEIFSIGGGTFVCVLPTSSVEEISSLVADFTKIENDFNQRKISNGTKKIGDLRNPQDSSAKPGIEIKSTFKKYSPEENGKLLALEYFVNELVDEIK